MHALFPARLQRLCPDGLHDGTVVTPSDVPARERFRLQRPPKTWLENTLTYAGFGEERLASPVVLAKVAV
jgi:hypothetical protein